MERLAGAAEESLEVVGAGGAGFDFRRVAVAALAVAVTAVLIYLISISTGASISRIASSSDSARTTHRTGPKISSL